LKVLIIYFSQTGNTEKIAETTKSGILKRGNICDIAQIKKVDASILENYDLIGIGTPTFFYREPRNVKKFIQDLKETTGKHCFLFCTHGSLIGNTFFYMNQELSKKGFIIIGNFDCYGDTSLQFYPDPMHTEGHPDEIEFSEAEEFGQKICEISSRIQKGESSLLPQFELISDTWWAKQSDQLTLRILRLISPKFKINEDKCTQCLFCQENCPVNAINIEAAPPEIQKEGCIFCWYCEKACPEGAIEADWSLMRSDSKNNLPRYIDTLKEEEKQGKFRPYVDYKNIF
jgi:flavodoxin/Fe-S-cluster-containing hydrogenase component 2